MECQADADHDLIDLAHACRNAMIRKLFTEERTGRETSNEHGWRIFWGIVSHAFAADQLLAPACGAASKVVDMPGWLRDSAEGAASADATRAGRAA